MQSSAAVTGRSPRVVICDDAPGYRLLTETVLTEAGFEVAGVAGDWDEAVRSIMELKPDVVLLDLWLPEFDAAQVARVCEHADGCVVAVVTALSEPEAREKIAGIDGVHLVHSKREPLAALIEALRERL